jgi:hypothetical protein
MLFYKNYESSKMLTIKQPTKVNIIRLLKDIF